MPSSALFLSISSPSAFNTQPSKPKNNIPSSSFSSGHRRLQRGSSIITYGCRDSGGFDITGFDLYELLGVERSSDQSQIKKAYRALQKRCHPDIAGAPGHDMAIVLNEVYALLSDPVARSAYDKEQATLSEFQGYTGKPLYSTWFGSESEERAVFVDEVKCVGCLKCALFANKTFAIESVYGRARVVSQWADPEDKIFDAIETCPVDCISIVERSDLAALEFLMSKQPRGKVRLTAGNTAGERVSNIFADVSKFKNRFHELKDKTSRNESQDSDLQRNIMSAIQGIRSISNWWYWQAPTTADSKHAQTYLVLTHKKAAAPDTERIREAAAKLKARRTEATAARQSSMLDDEYWAPPLVLSSPSGNSINNTSKLEPPVPDVLDDRKTREEVEVTTNVRKWSPVSLAAPFVMAVVSAAITAYRGADMTAQGGMTEHIGGTVALEVVNSFQLQVLLAGVTWFAIGIAVFEVIEAIGLGKGFYRK